MQNIGGRMKDLPQTMPAKVAHNAHAVCLDIGLDRIADIAKGRARAYSFDAFEQGVMGDLDQTLGFAT